MFKIIKYSSLVLCSWFPKLSFYSEQNTILGEFPMCCRSHKHLLQSDLHNLTVWILVLSEYNPIYFESPYKRKPAVNCLVAQQEESWQHYKLLVQHFKSAVKQNTWEEIQYCRVRERHFSGICFLFYDFQPQRRQISADTFEIDTNFEYFWLSSEVFPFNIVLNRKKRQTLVHIFDHSQLWKKHDSAQYYYSSDSQQCPPVKPKSQLKRMQSVH